jgi:ubiquinone/menaquinone biosynthesis C-methylase UbiE
MRSAYTNAAATYVSATRSFDRYPGLEAELIEFARSLEPGPVLDVGCGSDRDGSLLRRLGKTVVWADASEGILLASLGEIAGNALCCDVTALPLRTGAFAGVVASGVLLHLPKDECPLALSEIARVLSPSGRAVVSMKHGEGEGWRITPDFPVRRWFAYYQPEAFAELCRNAGFRVQQAYVSGRRDWFTIILTRL